MPRLPDPDRLAAYLDALGNWSVTGYIEFELNENAHRYIQRELAIKLKEIKELMYDHVAGGGEINEVRENRPKTWKGKDFEFHYELRFTINDKPVYIETRLDYRPPFEADQPTILVVNIHAR